MFYHISVRMNSRRDRELTHKVYNTLKAFKNLNYKKFKTQRAAEIALAKLPSDVRAECKVEAFELITF